ncbi:MAG TPA: hypothetical protein DIS66_02585 [Candidatus Omnitrophica bacterium]|nr:hypothetical protein [Candidatus Omnitrophota bacterium]
MIFKKLRTGMLSLVFFLAGAVFLSGTAFAANTDKYAPVYTKPLKSSSLKDPLSALLALPFEMIRWPISKSLLFTEKEYLPKKAEWLYTYLKNHGIQPSIGFMSGQGMQYGLKLDLPKLSGLQSKYPDFTFDTWVHYGEEISFRTGAEIGVERVAGTPFFVSGFFQYEDRWEDNFFGMGPDTSAGNGVSYGHEQTTVAGKAGYEFSPEWKGAFHLVYKNNNISEGESDDWGQLSYFGLNNIPGSGGDKILTLAADLKNDTRDFRDAPTRGGYRQIYFGYSEGLDDSNASYFTYRADMAQYFKVGSPRRVLAIRGLAEHHDEINGGNVPFYNMSKLGGYGTLPEQSHTLRSYHVNRFFGESLLLFNIEYRYTIWEYRELHMDAVPFFDFGQTFGEWSEFQFKDFKESYGLEFRVYVARNNLVNISIAHGDEGTNFFVRSKKAF